MIDTFLKTNLELVSGGAENCQISYLLANHHIPLLRTRFPSHGEKKQSETVGPCSMWGLEATTSPPDPTQPEIRV